MEFFKKGLVINFAHLNSIETEPLVTAEEMWKFLYKKPINEHLCTLYKLFN